MSCQIASTATTATTPPSSIVLPAPIAPDITPTSIWPTLFAPIAAKEWALLARPSSLSGVVSWAIACLMVIPTESVTVQVVIGITRAGIHVGTESVTVRVIVTIQWAGVLIRAQEVVVKVIAARNALAFQGVIADRFRAGVGDTTDDIASGAVFRVAVEGHRDVVYDQPATVGIAIEAIIGVITALCGAGTVEVTDKPRAVSSPAYCTTGV